MFRSLIIVLVFLSIAIDYFIFGFALFLVRIKSSVSFNRFRIIFFVVSLWHFFVFVLVLIGRKLILEVLSVTMVSVIAAVGNSFINVLIIVTLIFVINFFVFVILFCVLIFTMVVFVAISILLNVLVLQVTRNFLR